MWKNARKHIISGKMEGWFWLIAIALLTMTDPDQCEHFSFCLFKHLGIDLCPGRGLGHYNAMHCCSEEGLLNPFTHTR